MHQKSQVGNIKITWNFGDVHRPEIHNAAKAQSLLKRYATLHMLQAGKTSHNLTHVDAVGLWQRRSVGFTHNAENLSMSIKFVRSILPAFGHAEASFQRGKCGYVGP